MAREGCCDAASQALWHWNDSTTKSRYICNVQVDGARPISKWSSKPEGSDVSVAPSVDIVLAERSDLKSLAFQPRQYTKLLVFCVAGRIVT